MNEDRGSASARELSLNTSSIQEEEQYDGFYAVITNLDGDDEEIMRIHHNR